MDKEKYEIVPIGITKAGQWLAGGDVHQRLLDAAAGHPVIEDHLSQVESSPERSLTLPIAETGPLDVVFPVLHGPLGEDGRECFFSLVLGPRLYEAQGARRQRVEGTLLLSRR